MATPECSQAIAAAIVSAHERNPERYTLPNGFLCAGSPARELRPLSEGEMAYFTYSVNNYVGREDQHIDEPEAAAAGG